MDYYLVFDDKMKYRFGKADTLNEGIAILNKRNNKSGNIVRTMNNGKDYYKGYGIKNGKIKAIFQYSKF